MTRYFQHHLLTSYLMLYRDIFVWIIIRWRGEKKTIKIVYMLNWMCWINFGVFFPSTYPGTSKFNRSHYNHPLFIVHTSIQKILFKSHVLLSDRCVDFNLKISTISIIIRATLNLQIDDFISQMTFISCYLMEKFASLFE